MSIILDKSLILNRIKLHYGFNSDAEFARFLEIKPQTLSSWYSRNTFDIELLYAKCVDINPEYFFTGKDPFLKSTVTSNQLLKPNFENRVPQVVTVDSHNQDNIVLVPVQARAGYLTGYFKPEFLQTLPSYRLPSLNNGIFRMFEVKGQSMGTTLPSKSIAVGEWVDNWVNDIKDGRIYIIIYDDGDKMEDGVLIKRCLNRIQKYNNLVCKSDNLDKSSFPNISIDPQHVKEVWELKSALKFEFPDPSDLYGRINHLEAESQQIKDVLKQLSVNQGLNINL